MPVTFTGAFQRPAHRPSFLSIVHDDTPEQITVPVVTSVLLKPPEPRGTTVQAPLTPENQHMLCQKAIRTLLDTGTEWDIFKKYHIIKFSHPPNLPIFSEMRILIEGVTYHPITPTTGLPALADECIEQSRSIASVTHEALWRCIKVETKAYLSQRQLDIWWLRVRYPDFAPYIEIGEVHF